MITHVLIVVFLHSGNGSYPSVQFQEFTSKENCEKARVRLIDVWNYSKEGIALKGVDCLPK